MGGGPGYGLAGLSRLLTPEQRAQGQLPSPAPLPAYVSFLGPPGDQPPGGQGRVGRRGPALRGATGGLCPAAAPNGRPSPLLLLDWPGILPSAPALLSPGFQGADALTPDLPSVPRALLLNYSLRPLLCPPTCNFPRLQPPTPASAADLAPPHPAPQGIPRTCLHLGTAVVVVVGRAFPRRPRVAPGRGASSPLHGCCVRVSARRPHPAGFLCLVHRSHGNGPTSPLRPLALRLPVCAAWAFSSALLLCSLT